MSEARYPLRSAVLRSALFAAVATAVSLVGHVGAGGTAPPPAVFAAAWGCVALAGLPFARGPRSASALIGGIFGAQVLLHSAFTLAGGPIPTESVLAAASHVCSGGAADGGTGMLAAHLWAALVTGWWLAGGEEALWSVLNRLRTVFAAVPAAPAHIEAGYRPFSGGRPLPPLLALFLRHALQGRAPPVALVRRPPHAAA